MPFSIGSLQLGEGTVENDLTPLKGVFGGTAVLPGFSVPFPIRPEISKFRAVFPGGKQWGTEEERCFPSGGEGMGQ